MEWSRQKFKLAIGKPHPDPSLQPDQGYPLGVRRENVGQWPSVALQTG